GVLDASTPQTVFGTKAFGDVDDAFVWYGAGLDGLVLVYRGPSSVAGSATEPTALGIRHSMGDPGPLVDYITAGQTEMVFWPTTAGTITVPVVGHDFTVFAKPAAGVTVNWVRAATGNLGNDGLGTIDWVSH